MVSVKGSKIGQRAALTIWPGEDGYNVQTMPNQGVELLCKTLKKVVRDREVESKKGVSLFLQMTQSATNLGNRTIPLKCIR